jgi:hypothetical protein
MPEHYYNHSRRSHRSLADPYHTSPYPGISPYVQAPSPGEAGLLPEFGAAEAADTALAVPAAEAATTKAGGLLGGLAILATWVISRTWIRSKALSTGWVALKES